MKQFKKKDKVKDLEHRIVKKRIKGYQIRYLSILQNNIEKNSEVEVCN
jgi:hypothetical protein